MAEESLAAGSGPAAGASLQCTSTDAGASESCSPAGTESSNSAQPGQVYVEPQPEWGYYLAYDQKDGYVLMFGTNAKTWTFAHGIWDQLHPPVSPPARSRMSIAYDPVDQYVVMFGGLGLASLTDALNDTWTFSGGNWTNITSTAGPAPSPRYHAVMAFDNASNEMVLFGGTNNTLAYGDTWYFIGGRWTQIPTGGVLCGGPGQPACSISSAPSARYGASMVYYAAPKEDYLLLFGGGAHDPNATGNKTYSDTWQFENGAWTNITPAKSSPSARILATMAYDAHDQYVVLFGGLVSAKILTTGNDTWKFSKGSWVKLHPIVSPPARVQGGMVYDPLDGYVVLFGGLSSTAFNAPLLGDTWAFESGTWIELSPTISPSLRSGEGLVYDATDHYDLLFGGVLGPFYLGDTWRFVDGTWTKLGTGGPGPSPRYNVSMAFDAQDGYVVLFGGIGPSGVLGDTWTFANGSWDQIFPTVSPSARQGAALTYDAGDGYLVLFGGRSATTVLQDTWTFVGGEWTGPLSSNHPGPRYGASETYDPSGPYVLLFGGIKSNGAILGDTWTFLAGAWTNVTKTLPSAPSARFGASLTYDARDQYDLLFGGSNHATDLDDTWEFVAGAWTSVAPVQGPSARFGGAITFDTSGDYALLFGGNGSSGALNDTWSFGGGNWTQVSVSHFPGSRSFASMTYDSKDLTVVLFGGIEGSSILGDTWEYVNGVWSPETQSQIAPTARYDASMVYDQEDGYVLLFGGEGSTGSFNDTWDFTAGQWSNITPVRAPAARYGATMVYDPKDSYVMLFGGEGMSGPLNDTWEYRAGVWTQLTIDRSVARGAVQCGRDL